MLSTYLLFEQKINAPMFAYKILYDKDPPFISGHSSNHNVKNVDGVYIDDHIPTLAIKQLNKIKEIEARSSCEGSSLDRPTFFIFRFQEFKDEAYIKQFTNNLNKYKDIKSGYDIGSMGQYRICITYELWYNKDPELFNNWWLELPKKIKSCL